MNFIRTFGINTELESNEQRMVAHEYSDLSLSWTRKRNLFDIENVRDREKVTKTIMTIGPKFSIRDRGSFEIEGSRDQESSL